VSAPPAGDGGKLGVVLLNMGGPETLDEVRPFLFRLFRDPDILPLPKWLRWLAWPLAWLISTLRAPKSREIYGAIGGGSPLAKTNREVAAKLTEALAADGVDAVVTVAMRYWHPLTDKALDALEAAGVEQIVALPMYPQYSTTTTMSSYRELYRRLAKRRRRWRPKVLPVLDYHDDPGYLDCMRTRMRRAWATLPEDAASPAVLFSAHSIPLDRVTDLDDPYPQHVDTFMHALSDVVPPGTRIELGYQSRVGPVKWLEPTTPAQIEALAADGVDAVMVVPVSFVSEHVETLEELDQEYRELAHARGIRDFARVETVMADADFIEFCRARVQRARTTPPPHTCRRGAGQRCVCLQS